MSSPHPRAARSAVSAPNEAAELEAELHYSPELPESELLVTTAGQRSTAHVRQLLRYEPGVIIGGKYELSELLGEGGMGWVFGAQNLTLGVPVALKLMRSDLGRETHGLTERMLQEAQAAASLGHPSIIRVLDFGFTECADPFIVMEWLHGESLSRRLYRRGPLGVTRAVRVMLPIIDALAEAHDAKIVHRDIKPENIFLSRPAGPTDTGSNVQPKLLDFGIAKWTSGASARLTREGTILGSPAYMAPEQVRGEPDIDGRVDQWAACVVLYETVTGHRPFEAENYHAEMWSILSSDPKSLLAHGVNEPALWSIIARGLSKRREDRYGNLHELYAALSDWLNTRQLGQAVPPSRAAAALGESEQSSIPLRVGGHVLGLVENATGSLCQSVGDEMPASSARDSNGTQPASQPEAGAAARARRRLLIAVGIAALLCGVAVGSWFVASSAAIDPDSEDTSLDNPPQASRRARHNERAPRSLPRTIAPLPTTGPNAPLIYAEPRGSKLPPKPLASGQHVQPTEDL